jgi:hypothetical protein
MKLHMMDSLKGNIHQETAAIPVDLLQHVFAILGYCIQFCMDSGGSQFQHHV